MFRRPSFCIYICVVELYPIKNQTACQPLDGLFLEYLRSDSFHLRINQSNDGNVITEAKWNQKVGNAVDRA